MASPSWQMLISSNPCPVSHVFYAHDLERSLSVTHDLYMYMRTCVQCLTVSNMRYFPVPSDFTANLILPDRRTARPLRV